MEASTTKIARHLKKQMRAREQGIGAFALSLLAASLYSSCGSAQTLSPVSILPSR